MGENDFLGLDGFYPPEKDPFEDLNPVICDDGPEGPGKTTGERNKRPWERGPEPDYSALPVTETFDRERTQADCYEEDEDE